MKQDWKVRITLTETEGGPDTTRPWYYRSDIEQLISGIFVRAGKMRDLKINAITASESGSTYSDGSAS